MARPDRIDADALLIGARNGSEPFAAFYQHFERLLLGFFVRATGQPDLAADLAAETFASALESIGSFDPTKGRADQWLFGIARNVLGKSYRRGRVDASARQRLAMPTLVLDGEILDAIGRLTTDDEATLALAELPHEQRHAIEARVLGERDYGEIAGELRCSEAVVRQRVSRGLRALRTRLDGDA
jgi:RNA polymerase sigma-70 factor (ECF subfamily)